MQLRPIAKSSHAIDGRIIERPSTSLGHGWFHLRSSAWPRHFFIRRRVFISRAESGGRGEGGDIAISRASIRTIRIRGRTSEIYIVWTRIWTIIFAVPVLDIRCYLWQSFWEKSTSSKYCSIVSEISEFLDEEFPKEDGIGRNDELFWINFVNEGF